MRDLHRLLFENGLNIRFKLERMLRQYIDGWVNIGVTASTWHKLVTCTVDDSKGDVAGVYYYRFLYYLWSCSELQIAELGIG